MNEKLMEMSREAHSFAHKTEGSSYDNPEYDDAFAQKFSELIIKECAQLADNSPQYIDGREILEHFGVE